MGHYKLILVCFLFIYLIEKMSIPQTEYLKVFILFAQYFYSFYTFTGVIKQNIHAFSQVAMSFSNFTRYTHNNRDI